MVSLVVHAWWPALETQLRIQNCPVNLRIMVRGYLRDQEAVVMYAGGECKLGELRLYVQAFTDDVNLMFSEQSASSIEEETNHALAYVQCWGIRNKLRLEQSRCC
ncbi:hypothetical protein EVAR_35877_1 [Eumeta japonica]|uniref:Reverse transcriptase domain-containing protein n=1 Tax=Eumeta variegata TaxID=151549 RepID=A0A4C1WX22_EUMVA|nr:hypothetical protein EVAR_35877_1 [Eumeta japonica]